MAESLQSCSLAGHGRQLSQRSPISPEILPLSYSLIPGSFLRNVAVAQLLNVVILQAGIPVILIPCLTIQKRSRIGSPAAMRSTSALR